MLRFTYHNKVVQRGVCFEVVAQPLGCREIGAVPGVGRKFISLQEKHHVTMLYSKETVERDWNL